MISGARHWGSACAWALETLCEAIVSRSRRWGRHRGQSYLRSTTLATLRALRRTAGRPRHSVRRAASRRIVAITTEDQIIRAVVFRGRDVEAWATLDLHAEVVETDS